MGFRRPPAYTRLVFSPGERAELLVVAGGGRFWTMPIRILFLRGWNVVCTLLDFGSSVERPGLLGLKVHFCLEPFARDTAVF